MTEIIVILAVLSLVIVVFAIKDDRVSKGFKKNAKDGDGDGVVQEGTRWERQVKKKK